MIFGFIAKIYRKYQEYIFILVFMLRGMVFCTEKKIADIMYIRYKD